MQWLYLRITIFLVRETIASCKAIQVDATGLIALLSVLAENN